MEDSRFTISAAIVLYKEDEDVLKKTIDSFLNVNLSKKLYLIDNSPTNDLKKVARHKDIEYLHLDSNVGFAAANNTILNKVQNKSKYHLVLNPDITFKKNSVEKLINVIEKEKAVAMITPKIVYPNGDLQYNIRKFPSFFDLIIRKLNLFNNRIYDQEYRSQNLEKSFYPDAVHGCFQLYKTEDFVSLKGFDERYFLYMEDVDICKKIDAMGKKKLYYPEVSITHILKKGSSKSIKLFYYHLVSAIKYFLKWS